MNRKTVPGRDSAAPSWSAPVANRITATESLTQKAFNCLLQQNRHKADILTALSNVRFSNRPFGVKHFQTIRRCGVDVTHGLVLLFGIGTRALPSWDSKTRWNNADRRLMTPASLFAKLAEHYAARAEKPFSHIVVDEAQDLGVAE